MEFRLKYNFFKRKIVENLNFMHSWPILVNEILCTLCRKAVAPAITS